MTSILWWGFYLFILVYVNTLVVVKRFPSQLWNYIRWLMCVLLADEVNLAGFRINLVPFLLSSPDYDSESILFVNLKS